MNNDRNNDSYGNGHGGQQQNPDERKWRNQERNMNPSDNDDFNNQGWPEDEDRDAKSRTFNEDEHTYENEQRTTNSGTPNNNWDANDPTQRTTHIHDDEQWDAPSHGRFSDDEQNRYGQENNRRNREELEE